MQKFTRNTYEFVKQGLLQIQDEITKGERVCATRALKGIIGTMAPNREALLGYAYVRVRNRVGSKYGNTNRRAEIIAEKVQILMEAFWSRPTHYILDTDQYGAKFINTSSEADMSLEDAVRFAEMDGIVMIHDLNLGKGFEQYYLDTARNREILTHYAMSEENTSEREVFRRKAYAKFQMWWMFTHGIHRITAYMRRMSFSALQNSRQKPQRKRKEMFHFNHFNFNVLNLEKSLQFYQEALGLHEVRRKEAEDGSFILVYLGDSNGDFTLELTWLRDRVEKYDLGDEEFHLAFVTDQYEEAYKKHKEMGVILFENPEMGIYFIGDPDGYWIEIVPV